MDALHKLSTMGQLDKGAQELDPARWRYMSDAARVVVVFTDATYKTPMTYAEGSGGVVGDVIRELGTNNIRLAG